MEYCTKQELQELSREWEWLVDEYESGKMDEFDRHLFERVVEKCGSMFLDISFFDVKVKKTNPLICERTIMRNPFKNCIRLKKTHHDVIYGILRSRTLIPPPLIDAPAEEQQPLNERVFWLFHACYEARLLDAPVRILPLLGVLGRPEDAGVKLELVQTRLIDTIVNDKVPERNLLLVEQLLKRYLQRDFNQD